MQRRPYPMLLMLAMSLPGAARALGLGDIRIESALNEPLSAQVDIVGATREELAALTASVANQDIFQRYGADRPSFLSSAAFKVGVNGHGRPVLKIRSAEAFSAPVISFIVDLRSGTNEVVREYPLLLDPPGYPAPPRRVPAQLPAVRSAGRALHKVRAGDTLRAVPRQAAPSAAPGLAAVAAVMVPPGAAPVGEPDAALKARVASLERSLSDMHQQLATENANLRSLEDVIAPPQAALAETIALPIITSAHANPVVHTAAGSAPASDKNNWLASVALGASLLLAGLAYLRKRGTFPSKAAAQPVLVPAQPEAPAAATLQVPRVDMAPPDTHAVIESQGLAGVAADTSLDLNLLELDAAVTAEHVDMPSGLHERPPVGARRTHIADVLKSAIEQDPQRSDLRMKLLEAYYKAAGTNQRAFIDAVRKLSREPGRLSREEWHKVNVMGREIAADDILFAGAPKDDDLAVCA